MYTLLVVDDEEDIRRGIIHSIDWDAWGFTVVGEAANGIQAVSLIEAHRPDVVLSDIRMPGMDGLELMRYVQENHPDTMVVILSGYSDFAYLESAFKHDVFMYLLKPTDMVEFESTFHSVHKKLAQKKQDKETLEKSNAYIRDYQMTRLVQGLGLRSEDVQPIADNAGIPLDFAGCYLAIAAPDYTEDWFAENPGWRTTQRIMVSLLNKALGTDARCNGLFFLHAQSMVCGVLSAENASAIMAFWQSAQEVLRVQLGLPDVLLGVSGMSTGSRDFPTLLVQARQALCTGLQAYTKAGASDGLSAHQLTTLLVGQQAQQAHRLIASEARHATATLHDDFNAMDRVCMKLLFTLSDAAERVGVDLPSILQTAGYTFEALYDIESAAGKYCFILFAARQLLACLQDIRVLGSNEQLTNEVLELVEREYCSNQMSLGYVCEKLGRSQAYVSRVFKEVSGESFVHYIRKKRMDMAFTLLRETNHQTYKVAEMVGYTDMSNFQKTFKKYFGMTPAECRRLRGGVQAT